MSLACEGLGYTAAWFSEMADEPSSVLAHHWPQVRNLGDMTAIPGLLRSGAIEAPDILVGGTPCQAFSIAGLRGGLADPRGLLTKTFVEIGDEIDHHRKTPCTLWWENVVGCLNTKDNAFGNFIGALTCGYELYPNDDKPIIGKTGKFWGWDDDTGQHYPRWPTVGYVVGPKRSLAWRVLDAKYFGSPQRRRRVFVVASAADGFDPLEVLFEPAGCSRFAEPGPEYRPPEHPGPATPRAFDMLGFGQYGDGQVASTLKARDYKDATDLVVMPDGRVRRITPIEGERLQGMPDNHTLVPHKGKPMSDSARYKMIGNSMSVYAMRWIGSHLKKHLHAIGLSCRS